MDANKELTLKMLDFIEELYFENTFMKALLTKDGPESLNRQLATARKQVDFRKQVSDLFSPLRQRLLEEHDLAAAMQEFLRVLPAKKDVN